MRNVVRMWPGLALLGLAAGGCGGGNGTSDLSSAPLASSTDGGSVAQIASADAASSASVRSKSPDNYWTLGATVRWNEIARGLVQLNNTAPPPAARVYALLSIAQYNALLKARGERHPKKVSEPAVVAGASAAILAKLYPGQSADIDARAKECAASGGRTKDQWDIDGSIASGKAAAAALLQRAASDGADAVLNKVAGRSLSTPWWSYETTSASEEQTRSATRGIVDPSRWTGTNPTLPEWGTVRTWLVSNVAANRPPIHPKFGSPAFQAALAEVRKISDTRTAEQLRIAKFWADGGGTATPPGHWNAIACDLIVKRKMDDLQSAKVLAYLNMAEMDAGICCWDAKFTYWLIRPYQADTAITTPVGRPNFPSYTSGHSTFSGAAATYLSAVFPNNARQLKAMAEEASMSRVYGGIHYRFDCEMGIKKGNEIGALAAQRYRSEKPV